MNRKERILAILAADSSDNWKAAAIESLFADEFRDFVYRQLEAAKTQGVKWIEKIKKSAQMETRDTSEYEEQQI